VAKWGDDKSVRIDELSKIGALGSDVPTGFAVIPSSSSSSSSSLHFSPDLNLRRQLERGQIECVQSTPC
jgi:hypothetical protein